MIWHKTHSLSLPPSFSLSFSRSPFLTNRTWDYDDRNWTTYNTLDICVFTFYTALAHYMNGQRTQWLRKSNEKGIAELKNWNKCSLYFPTSYAFVVYFLPLNFLVVAVEFLCSYRDCIIRIQMLDSLIHSHTLALTLMSHHRHRHHHHNPHITITLINQWSITHTHCTTYEKKL